MTDLVNALAESPREVRRFGGVKRPAQSVARLDEGLDRFARRFRGVARQVRRVEECADCPAELLLLQDLVDRPALAVDVDGTGFSAVLAQECLARVRVTLRFRGISLATAEDTIEATADCRCQFSQMRIERRIDSRLQR